MEICIKFGHGWTSAMLVCLTTFMVYDPVTAIQTYDLEDHCDTKISMIWQSFYQGRFILSSTLMDFDDASTCDVEVESWYSYNRMMVYFDEFNLSCQEGQLELFDGDITHNRHVTGLETPLCGHNKPEGIFVTDNMDLNIRYIENTGKIQGRVSIIVTSFNDDISCASYEYKCENSRCIIDDINCSGYNPCGDHSDCQTELDAGAWVGIVIGSIVGVAVLFTVIFGAICCYRSSIRRRQMQQQQANYRAAHGTATFSQPQPFVPGQQQAYPSNFSHQQYVQGQWPNQGQQPYPAQGQQSYPVQSHMPYPTQGQNMQSPQQTTYGVQQATYSQQNIPTQLPTAPVLDMEPPPYSSLDIATRDDHVYTKPQE